METGSVLQRKEPGQPQHPQISEEIESVWWHIPKALESPFAELLHSYGSHTPPFTKFCIKTCGFVHIKFSYCKLLSQKISHNEKNLQ